MIKAFVARLKQGHRTMRYPAGPAPALSKHYRGLPRVEPVLCSTCGAYEASSETCPARAACPTAALLSEGGAAPGLDLGRCLFCGACEVACPSKAIAFGGDHRLSTRRREELVLAPGSEGFRLATALEGRIKKLLGRSLKLREVSAGGCNACEADINVLGTVGWDLGRFGIQFVASPRHADGLVLTGPLTPNMELALRKTWDAIPEPKVAIAIGACAISGGVYRDLAAGSATESQGSSPASMGGAPAGLPIDLYIPGCPPHPLTILDGLLRLVGRMEERG